ncbi:hypothetical protein [Kutzneria sp. NPDC051319]|uniref:hypothetical protein n=1 Tax=Kutzneria sp. NPDC051319 TaxID=3155047 RepID=UPI0034237648
MATALSRLLAGAVVTTMAAGFAVTSLAGTAAAVPSTSNPPISWAYTDSAAPTTTVANPAGTAPVGAQVDASGTTHSDRAYFTFDLSRFTGATVASAQLAGREISVADCTKARIEQVWLTATATAPTWAQPPVEQLQLDGPHGDTQACPSGNLTWDAATAIQQALAAGATQATFELRLPEDQQNDPSLLRTFDHAPTLTVIYDHAPLAPSKLAVDGKACGSTPAPVGKEPYTHPSVTQTDPDNDFQTTEFDWWPVDHPDQMHTGQGPTNDNSTVQSIIDQSLLADGVTYAWRARTTDGGPASSLRLTGPWSDVCQFTVDLVAPPKPIVSSSDYPTDRPSGGSGLPGTFVFSPNGSTETVGYLYGLHGTPENYVAASADGTASVRVTPSSIGSATMTVADVDKAGNKSVPVDYRYTVQDNTPKVVCTPTLDYIGRPRTCTITPRDTGNVGYRYQIDGGPNTDVPANPDGTGTFTMTPTSRLNLNVRARLTNGNTTDATLYSLAVDPGTPTVDQSVDHAVEGTAVQFTFHATLPGSTTFTYTWGYHDPATVPAQSDGTATVSLLTDQPGGEDLYVYSTTADGVNSDRSWTSFTVDSNAPTWSSPQFADGSATVGVTATLTFAPTVPGVVSYTYWFSEMDSPVTVPAGADGTATVQFTPTLTGNLTLQLTGNFADGTQTELTEVNLPVNAAP